MVDASYSPLSLFADRARVESMGGVDGIVFVRREQETVDTIEDHSNWYISGIVPAAQHIVSILAWMETNGC